MHGKTSYIACTCIRHTGSYSEIVCTYYTDLNPSLPVNCTVLSDTQQCQCSCNPGFTESTGSNPYFECKLPQEYHWRVDS